MTARGVNRFVKPAREIPERRTSGRDQAEGRLMARLMECVLLRDTPTRLGRFTAGLTVYADLDVEAPAGQVECVMSSIKSNAGVHELRALVPDSALQLGGEVAA